MPFAAQVGTAAASKAVLVHRLLRGGSFGTFDLRDCDSVDGSRLEGSLRAGQLLYSSHEPVKGC